MRHETRLRRCRRRACWSTEYSGPARVTDVPGRNAAVTSWAADWAAWTSRPSSVLRAIEERDVRFVRMWFTDVLGFLKSVAVAPAELEGAFAEGMGFDGSAIEGFARVYESDMLAHPDPSTFQVLLPARHQPGYCADVL